MCEWWRCGSDSAFVPSKPRGKCPLYVAIAEPTSLQPWATAASLGSSEMLRKLRERECALGGMDESIAQYLSNVAELSSHSTELSWLPAAFHIKTRMQKQEFPPTKMF